MAPWLRSVVAVLDGILVIVCLYGLCEAAAIFLFHRSFDAPTVPFLLVNLCWSLLAAFLGGLVTGKVSRRAPVAHGVVLMILLWCFGALNVYKGFGGTHTWYVIAVNLLGPVFCVLGATRDKPQPV